MWSISYAFIFILINYYTYLFEKINASIKIDIKPGYKNEKKNVATYITYKKRTLHAKKYKYFYTYLKLGLTILAGSFRR